MKSNNFRSLPRPLFSGDSGMRRPKVKLDHLVTVMAVAEKHDIEVAAREIGLTASAVRKQLDAVEGMLGVRLFEGKKGSLVATEDGEVFLWEAKESVEHALLAEAKTLARQALRNHHLLVGHSTYLPPRVIIHPHDLDGEPMIAVAREQHLIGNFPAEAIDDVGGPAFAFQLLKVAGCPEDLVELDPG